MAKARPRKRIDFETFEQVSLVLRVLAHPHRLRIVEILLERPVSVGEVAAGVGLPAAAVSQHLAQMRAHGIVTSRRKGRCVYYEVTNPHAVNLIGCIANFGVGR